MLALFTSCTNSPNSRFTPLPLPFTNALAESPDFNVLKYGYFYNGGGVGIADFNGDDIPDIYLSGNLVTNRLLFGKGNLEYRVAPEEAGIGGVDGWNTGVSVVDINGDGRPDIYQCRSAATNPRLRRNLLFVNNGDETFTERAAEYGLDDNAYTTQAAFFDYDRDGDLDCFILNHSVQKFAGFSAVERRLKERVDTRYSSRLMRNDGGRFRDVTQEAGLTANVLSFGLGVAVNDFDNDGWADIYVSNDYNEEDYLYRNRGDGTFEARQHEAFDHLSLFSMGSETADLDNDGRVDLVTLDMLPEGNERIKMTAGADNYRKFRKLVDEGFHRQYSRNMLQLNVGEPGAPSFVEVGQQYGISNSDWSWSVLAGDLDLDGWQDLYITNGYARDYTNMEFLNYTVGVQQRGKKPDPMEVIANMPSISEPNFVYRNVNGKGFENKVGEWTSDRRTQSNGAALADLDGDGDLDIVVNNVNAPASLHENRGERYPATGQSLVVDLTKAPGHLAIGARVKIFIGARTQEQRFYPVRGFQSSSYTPLVFGLGTATTIDSVTVRWTNGRRSVVRNPEPGSNLRITRPRSVPAEEVAGPVSVTSPPTPAFSAQTTPPYWGNGLFVHETTDINDFNRQPLLPFLLSGTGPALALHPNGTFFIGGGRNQSSNLFSDDAPYEDSDAVFTDINNDGQLDLIVVSAGYELAPDDPALKPRVYLKTPSGFVRSDTTILPDIRVSASTIVVADFDGDGDDDLFIGSRVNPGRYPEGGTSYLLANVKGRFELVQTIDMGMVTGAVAIPSDNADVADLLIAREFGTIAHLHRPLAGIDQEERLESVSPSGVWQSLHKSEGPDGTRIVTGNLGTNNQLAAVTDGPLRLYAFPSPDGTRPIPILSLEENGTEYPFAARDELVEQLPALKKRFTDYVTYSRASLQDVFGPLINKAPALIAKEFRSGLLTIDEEGKFTFTPLPHEAQRAPVLAAAFPDLNLDGYPDLITAGNRMDTRVRIGSLDASRGEVFLSDGNTGYEYIGSLGLKGEVRHLEDRGEDLLIAIRGDTLRHLPLVGVPSSE